VRDDAGMLHDLDLSVAAFLSRLLPAGTAVRFGPPGAAWGTAPGGVPLLGAFLYDVREVQSSASASLLARDEDGRPAGWQRPVHRYQVSYLLTAWPGHDAASAPTADEAVSEHGLLGSVLLGCGTADSIPPDCLCGVLAATGEPVPLVCAAADRAADALQIWPVLGVPARTALDLKVVAAVVPPLLTELGAGVDTVEMGLRRQTAPPEPDDAPPRPQRHITER
jgi:hypothetical protein